MKKTILTLSTAAGLAVLPLLMTGCSTPKGVATSESAVSSLQDIEVLLNKGDQQISATMTSLNEIGKTIKIDPRKAYKQFASDVDDLEKLAKEVASRGEQVKARADEHYTLWEQEIQSITNPTLKQQGSERREKVMADFRSFEESVDSLRLSFRPYMDDLKDLVTFFGTDLTVHGYSAAAEMMTGMKSQAVSVQNDLRKVIGQINKLKAEMAVTPPDAAK